MISLPLIPGTLPPNYCFSGDWQDVLNDFMAVTTVQFDATGATIVLAQNSVPDATQRGALWLDTRVDRTYRWDATVGAWVARHPYAPGTGVRLWWEDSLGALATFDGGDGSPTGDASGAMWEEDVAYRGRFPLHVGTLPSGAVVALSATGGDDTMPIAQANLPNVTLPVLTDIIGANGVGAPENVVGQTYGSDTVAGSGRVVDSTSSDFSGRYKTRGQTNALGSGTELNVLNPYRAGYWIKRSARIYYKAS